MQRASRVARSRGLFASIVKFPDLRRIGKQHPTILTEHPPPDDRHPRIIRLAGHLPNHSRGNPLGSFDDLASIWLDGRSSQDLQSARPHPAGDWYLGSTLDFDHGSANGTALARARAAVMETNSSHQPRA